MLADLLRKRRFRSELAAFARRHHEQLIDIILFGSAVRGKERPRDIDILLLVRGAARIGPAYELRKALAAAGIKAEVVTKNWRDLLSPRFLPREGILAEGWSWALKRQLAAGWGYAPFALFKYSLKGFSASKRIRFHYALEGRGPRPGIIRSLGAIKFTTAVVLVPITQAEPFRRFLADWGIEPLTTHVLVPERSLQFMRF